MFDPGRLLVVRVENLKRIKSKARRSREVKNPLFYSWNLGCLVKTSQAKTLLREKKTRWGKRVHLGLQVFGTIHVFNWNKTWGGTHSMYWVSLPLIIVQAYRLLKHLHVFGTGRPNWRRTCPPSFLHYWPFSKLSLPPRTILGVGSQYIFWLLSVWQLGCVSGLFLLTRVGAQGVCSCFGDFELGRKVLGVKMVHQFQLVSWHLCHIVGWMEIRLLLIEGYTCRPITLPLILLAIGPWRCPTVYAILPV